MDLDKTQRKSQELATGEPLTVKVKTSEGNFRLTLCASGKIVCLKEEALHDTTIVEETDISENLCIEATLHEHESRKQENGATLAPRNVLIKSLEGDFCLTFGSSGVNDGKILCIKEEPTDESNIDNSILEATDCNIKPR